MEGGQGAETLFIALIIIVLYDVLNYQLSKIVVVVINLMVTYIGYIKNKMSKLLLIYFVTTFWIKLALLLLEDIYYKYNQWWTQGGIWVVSWSTVFFSEICGPYFIQKNNYILLYYIYYNIIKKAHDY